MLGGKPTTKRSAAPDSVVGWGRPSRSLRPQRCSRRSRKDLGRPVLGHFDLVTGTSTGGIIALALDAGMSPREVIGFYEAHGPRIFAYSRLRTHEAVLAIEVPGRPVA